ncbi:MAG: DUF4926 domain-containing protein [Cyanothece sp. SIO2G6]|nr:DUF4926 domain-containing protein [Cyanothece sp. SIO2G6]
MKIEEYDIIALNQPLQTIHKETQQPILLRCGQIGTVLEILDEAIYLIDFSDANGQTYAMETVAASQVMPLF